jgi:hypothetical protein
VAFSGSNPATFTPPNDETPDLRGFRGDGRYWARTSDPQLVELIQRGHGRTERHEAAWLRGIAAKRVPADTAQ